MQQFTQETFKHLIELPAMPTISLYMPVFKKGADQQQNPIRLANLIKKARLELETSPLVTHQLKESLTQLETDSKSANFWAYLGLGAVFFVYESEYKAFRLPLETTEHFYLDHHHYLKPLLPLLTTNGNFFILTLSQNNVKLYEATRTTIDKRFLGNIPRSLEQHLQDFEVHKHLQLHTSGGNSTGFHGPAVFHGQGAGDESLKKDIEEFLNQVENGVTAQLQSEDAPLLLAGVEYLTSMYANLNKYRHLIPTTLEGNFEQMTKEDLHQQAWKIVRPIFKSAEKQALDKYGKMSGTGKTSTKLEEIVVNAIDGRIDTLFVTRDLIQWGKYNHTKRTVILYPTKKPGSRDLYDLASFITLTAGGIVYSLKPEEMIKDAQIAAVYRY